MDAATHLFLTTALSSPLCNKIMVEEAYNHLLHHGDEDEYIDMEILSSSSHMHAQNTDFEFQTLCSSTTPLQTPHSSTPSPADDLFYRGRLLPLFPPPIHVSEEELFSTPLETPTPFQSCTVSPSESCRVSTELNKDYHHFPKEVEEDQLHTWTNKPASKKSSWISKMKQSSMIASKLKASTAYLKSFFAKSEKTKMTMIQQQYNNPKTKQCQEGELSFSSASINENRGQHRRSFSVVSIKRPVSSSNITIPWTSNSPLSTYFPSKNHANEGLLKRSSSVSLSGIESPISGAIAHCKKSSQHDIIVSPNYDYQSRNTTSTTHMCEAAAATAGFISISSSARVSVSSDNHSKLVGISRG